MIETNFDSLIGPTHHYGGLGVGNIASHDHAMSPSNPKQAALQGLAKMATVAKLGIPQFILPPCVRPNREFLARHGFGGSLQDQLQRAYQEEPRLLSAAYSSAFMWTANAATVTPATQSADGCLHITIANLDANLHRAQEAKEREQHFRRIFEGVPRASIHEALSGGWPMRDEGAANHMRFWNPKNQRGIELFVYGDDIGESADPTSTTQMRKDFLPRHGALASRSIARLHNLATNQAFFLKQHPLAIASGVFHNDVIATSNEQCLFYHQDAFDDSEQTKSTLAAIDSAFELNTGIAWKRIEVKRDVLSMKDAVASYLFNSQIISVPKDQGMVLICPQQCHAMANVRSVIEAWIADPSNPICNALFLPLDQSMANGGGPACLRLRVPLDSEQLQAIPKQYAWNEDRHAELETWINKWYPDRLEFSDLARPDFAEHALATVASMPF